MTTHRDARTAVDRVRASRALEILARSGFAASGLVHVLLGYLAVRVATNHDEESDQSGALAQVAELPGGTIVLWLTVVGLAALGLWLLAEAALGIGSTSKKRWVRSVKPAAKAVAYLALGWTAARTALGAAADSAGATTQASASLLSLPGGRLLLVLVGLVAMGVGGYLVGKGLRERFRDDIRIPSGRAGRTVVFLGVLGYLAKGLAIIVVGILFVVAAATVDPEQASGLDGALKALASLPFGQLILVTVGFGLVCYGAYSFARAKYARLR